MPSVAPVLRDKNEVHIRHSAGKLFQCLKAAAVLKSGPLGLCDTVESCLRIAAPAFLVPAVTHKLRSGSRHDRLPSSSLLRRYEICLDVAITLIAKDREPLLFARYGHADSSPMAGYDWFWMQRVEIRLHAKYQCCWRNRPYKLPTRQTSLSDRTRSQNVKPSSEPAFCRLLHSVQKKHQQSCPSKPSRSPTEARLQESEWPKGGQSWSLLGELSSVSAT